ncbi:DASH complex subunit Dad1-domain-containing protein [Terfezia claveryi]|nr:DASH complex subunit Dad1-domain-containing protein [Terfezia claveryi]
MMSARRNGGDNSSGEAEKSFFELERARLVTEISLSLDHVLMNLNLLNRSLEGVISVGKEFESVETLWSQFEGVIGSGAGGGVEIAEVADGSGKEPAGDESMSEVGEGRA